MLRVILSWSGEAVPVFELGAASVDRQESCGSVSASAEPELVGVLRSETDESQTSVLLSVFGRLKAAVLL